MRCSRCDRRICPDCMVEAAVGFHCPDCVREGNKGVRQARTVFGGRVDGDPGWVSKVLIGINLVAFVLEYAAPGFKTRLLDIGAFPPPPMQAQLGVAAGEYYRLLTSAFLHEGVLHLLLNMYVLFLFGPALESALGRWRFAGLYLVSALGGSAVSYAFSPPAQPSLGASGAVFGLLGAYFVVSRRLRRDTTPLLVLLAINLAYGFLVPRVDWKAHLGGLVAGGLVGLAMVYAPKERRTLVQVVGTVLVLVAVVALVAWRTSALRGEMVLL